MGVISWKSKADADGEAAAAEQERLEAEQADAELAAAIDAATTLEELKQALLGKSRPARVRAKPI
jgi:hypothetical protein